MKKYILVSVILILIGGLFFSSCSERTTTHYRTTTAVKPKPTISEAPDWIEKNPSANNVYTVAKEIMTDSNFSREEKAKRMHVLQRTFGEELLCTVVRYVPVYNENSGNYVTFDNYMKDMARDYPAAYSDAPIVYDPVGAATLIFFDSSPETIAAVTGVGLSQEEVKLTRNKFNEEQKRREEKMDNFETNLVKTWEKANESIEQAGQQAQKWTEDKAKDAQKWADDTAKDTKKWAEDKAKDAQKWADDTAKDVQKWADDTAKDVNDWLDDIFK